MFKQAIVVLTVLAGGLFAMPRPALAHCDTLSGPVVAAAKLALQKGDVTPVLRWIKPEAEPEIRTAFARTLKVRNAGPDARDLADMYFFETLVRMHRAGEGVPFTGLKPADTDIGPAVKAADQAIEDGSIDRVTQLVIGDITAVTRRRFARVIETNKLADQSVAAGREFVEAYVEYVHFVENVHLLAAGKSSGHAEGGHAVPTGVRTSK